MISNQRDDSSIINIAGRQRMLSQKLVKELILLEKTDTKEELQTTLSEWTTSHYFLKEKVSEEGRALFDRIEAPYDTLREASREFLSGRRGSVAYLLDQQILYLEGMEAIVSQFEMEATGKIDRLKRTEFFLTILALLVLLLEIFFLFRPAAKYIENLVSKLGRSEKKYMGIAEENADLLSETERSLKELQSLNYAIDHTALFASLNLEGETIYISGKLKALLEIERNVEGRFFHELISSKIGEQEFVKKIISTPRSDIWVGEVNITSWNQNDLCLEMSVIPFNQAGIQQKTLVLCSDLSLRKKAEQEVSRLKDEYFKSEIVGQKNRAIQVMESQEEERKRIAKDMHDGIGQMLTALKFNIESINFAKPEKAKSKLELIKKISGDLIKGVRIATFNLTPPELGDFGIVTALSKLAEGLENLTGKKIHFINKTNFDERFEFNIEINLYRVVQEAVNNAIKYANSDYIIITCSHSRELLSISVDDNGRGFQSSEISDTKRKDGSGMGLAFMKERISYINGRIFISSALGEGTKVTINIPISG